MHNLPEPDEKYYFEVLNVEGKEEMLQFLLDGFRLEEPLNKASKISSAEIEKCLNGALERSLRTKSSIVARCQGKKELDKIETTLFLQEPMNCTPEGEEEKDFEFPTVRKEVEMVGEILNELHESFWNLRPDQDVVLHFEISSVGKNHRRQGLASKFMNWTESRALLQSLGATGIATEASSLANQVLLSRRGYETLATTLLETKVDPDTGKPLLVCDDGTDRVSLMFKEI